MKLQPTYVHCVTDAEHRPFFFNSSTKTWSRTQGRRKQGDNFTPSPLCQYGKDNRNRNMQSFILSIFYIKNRYKQFMTIVPSPPPFFRLPSSLQNQKDGRTYGLWWNMARQMINQTVLYTLLNEIYSTAAAYLLLILF